MTPSTPTVQIQVPTDPTAAVTQSDHIRKRAYNDIVEDPADYTLEDGQEDLMTWFTRDANEGDKAFYKEFQDHEHRQPASIRELQMWAKERDTILLKNPELEGSILRTRGADIAKSYEDRRKNRNKVTGYSANKRLKLGATHP